MSKSQERGYKVLDRLFGHELDGISCQDIAKSLNEDKATILRDLQAQAAAGLAEQLPSKRWVISPKFGLQAIKIFHSMDRGTIRLNEAKARYTQDGD